MNFFSLILEAIIPRSALRRRNRDEVWDMCEGSVPKQRENASKRPIIISAIRLCLLAAIYFMIGYIR
jgi:hypothetical protein